MSSSRFCSSCGAPLTGGAKFCHRCGEPTDGRAGGGEPSQGRGSATPGGALPPNVLPWSVAAIALLCLLAFLVGQLWRSRSAPVAGAGPAAASSDVVRGPDISQMSPTERADRLFERVMSNVERGNSDSVSFFAPMAIQSQLDLAPLDLHRRYDLGLLAMVSGEVELARAQADSILRERPTHLLGLILSMRLAGMQQDSLARRRFADRLLASLDAERAARLPEYVDHAPDIDASAREASGAQPRRLPVPTPR